MGQDCWRPNRAISTLLMGKLLNLLVEPKIRGTSDVVNDHLMFVMAGGAHFSFSYFVAQRPRGSKYRHTWTFRIRREKQQWSCCHSSARPSEWGGPHLPAPGALRERYQLEGSKLDEKIEVFQCAFQHSLTRGPSNSQQELHPKWTSFFILHLQTSRMIQICLLAWWTFRVLLTSSTIQQCISIFPKGDRVQGHRQQCQRGWSLYCKPLRNKQERKAGSSSKTSLSID